MKLTLTTAPAQKQLTMADLRPGDFAEIVENYCEGKYLGNIICCLSVDDEIGCYGLNNDAYWIPSDNNTLKVRKLAPGETLTITE